MRISAPGCMWDVNLGAWWDDFAPGWRSDGTWKEVIQVYWNLDSGSTGSAWNSDTHLEACMRLRCWLDESQMQFCGSGLDGAEMPFCGPGWRWVVTKMEVKHKYKDLDLIETQPQMERRHKSRSLAGGEMQILKVGWISCNGTTSEIQLSWPGLRWDVTWIVVSCEYRDLDGRGKGEGEMQIFVIKMVLGWRWHEESWGLHAGDAGSGWRRDTNLETWIALRWELEGAEIQYTRPGWRWDVTLMELRRESYDLDWAGMRPEWGEHLETWMVIYDAWMELGCNFGDLGRGEAHILKLAWVWDGAWMELRCNIVDLDGDETSPKWKWNANVGTCIELRHGLDGEMLI